MKNKIKEFRERLKMTQDDLAEKSDKHFHTYLSSYSFSISVPGHTKSYKEISQFGKCAVLAKTSETGSTEASALTPSCIHIAFFSRLVSISNCCKNIFLPAQKCPYTYSKDEGHKYRLLMKKFLFFPVKNTLT